MVKRPDDAGSCVCGDSPVVRGGWCQYCAELFEPLEDRSPTIFETKMRAAVEDVVVGMLCDPHRALIDRPTFAGLRRFAIALRDGADALEAWLAATDASRDQVLSKWAGQ